LLRKWLVRPSRARRVEIAGTFAAVLGLVLLVELAAIVPTTAVFTAWGIAALVVCSFAVANARRKKP